MAEQNGSGDQFSNVTSQTVPVFLVCARLRPLRSVQIISYTMILFLSLIGNSFVIAVFYRNKTLRTSVHYFIANMAISDLIIPMVVLPWQISETYHDSAWLLTGVLGSILCKLLWVAWDVSVVVSILSMMTIAVDRFHAVLFAMKPPLISQKTRRVTIVVIWVSSVAFGVSNFDRAIVSRFGTGVYCMIQWGSLSDKITNILFLSIFFPSALLVTVLYSWIIVFIHRQKGNLQMASEVVKSRRKENQQVACMLMIVVAAFFSVFVPFTVLVIILYMKPEVLPPCVFYWFSSSFLPVLYTVVNPVLYYIFNENYRQGFRELLCCPWSCTNNCTNCSQLRVLPLGENKAPNARKTCSPNAENIELQQQ